MSQFDNTITPLSPKVKTSHYPNAHHSLDIPPNELLITPDPLLSAQSTKPLSRQLVHLCRRTLVQGCRIMKRIIGLALLFGTLGFGLLFFAWPLIQPYSTLAQFKIRNYLFNEGYISCSLRKQPVLFVVGTHHALAIWESNCVLKEVKIRWYLDGNQSNNNSINGGDNDQVVSGGTSEVLTPVILDTSHHVYKAIIGPISVSAPYVYVITHTSNREKESVLALYKFRLFLPATFYSNQRQSYREDNHTDHPNSISSTPEFSADYPIKILAIADNQFGLKVFNKILDSAVGRHSPPNFLLHAGDAVQDYDQLQQWQTDFYDPLTRYHLGQEVPIIYARGNHDFDPRLEYTYTSDSLWHAFSIANTRWIVLDSNIDDVAQDQWLVAELQSPDSQNAAFRIVVVHIPPFVEFWDPDAWNDKGEKHWGEFVRTRFVPIFRKFKVDLVISGHQHNYQRGRSDGVVYTIIGGAGGELDYKRVEDWHIFFIVQKTFHYVNIEIWEEKIKWFAHDLHGAIIDKFELSKKTWR
ncbi:hypothetical protein G9A89_007204 [Geosiphon pyriformis]|nr:hypothetical protein G9A89_007204 [Geosiphon pyriformis]